MLNNLPLIIVLLLSLFLAFYCVDSHKKNIVSMINTEVNAHTNKKNVEPLAVKAEKKLIKQEVQNAEEIYVEALAVKDINETTQIESKIDKNIKEVKVQSIEPEQEREVVVKVKPKEAIEVKVKKPVEDKTVAEYSEGYKLDDLEKMIMEELKKRNKE